MRVRFWGVRGSVPSPVLGEEIEEKLVRALRGAQGVDLADDAAVRDYVQSLPVHLRRTWGGNTTCVEVRFGDDELIVIDAGSGIRALGQSLLDGPFGRGEGRAAVLFTHTHWDHIQGFPFFPPLFVPGNRFEIHGRHEGLRERLEYQHDFRVCPYHLDIVPATLTWHQAPEEFELFGGQVRVRTAELDHPGTAYAYRIEHQGKVVVMASDCEYRDLTGPYWQRYVDFYRGADVFIFDAQYTLREALVERETYGHSSAMIGIDLAHDAGVRTIVMVHHDPSYNDDKIKGIFDGALRYLDRTPAETRPEVLVGYEGLTIDL